MQTIWDEIGDIIWDEIGDIIWDEIGDIIWDEIGETIYWEEVISRIGITSFIFKNIKMSKNKNFYKKNGSRGGSAAEATKDNKLAKGVSLNMSGLRADVNEVIEEGIEQDIWYDPVLKNKGQLYLRIGQNINSASRFSLDMEWQQETGKRYESGVSAYFVKRTGKGYEITYPDQRRALYKLENYFNNMFLRVLSQPICDGQIYIVKGNLIEISNTDMDPEIYTDYKEFLTYAVGSDGEPLLEPGTVTIEENISIEDFINNFYFRGGRTVKDLFLQESKKEYNSLCDEVLNVLKATETLTKETIMQKIKDLKLYGFGGFCADAAIEINNKVFNGNGEYVASANKFWFEKENRILGHVVVKYNDTYWDSEGQTTLDKVESWGMVDEEDPEYSDHPEWKPKDAYEVELLELTEDEVMKYFNICRPQTLKEVMTFLFENNEEKKLKLKLRKNNFSKISHWTKPIKNISILKDPSSLDLFDQNGYHLTLVEREYCKAAKYPISKRREELVCCKPWFASNKMKVGPHLNHTELFERKGFAGKALEQLKSYAKENPLLWKLIKMKPKWGIDLSIDYVDDNGNVFEIFHYEWDDFDFKKVQLKKEQIEKFALSQDWEKSAQELFKHRNEWENLDFFEQSKWKTDFYGLEPEKFKNVIWKKMKRKR